MQKERSCTELTLVSRWLCSNSHYINSHRQEQSEQACDINLVVIWCVFRLSFRMLWTGPNYIPIMLATLKRYWLFCFCGNVPSLDPLIVCFASWWLSQTFRIFSRGHTTVCTPPKILCSSCFLCSLSYFQLRNRYLASFPQFKIKFDADTIF